MPKPICVKCQRFYRPHRNSTYVLEQMPTNGAEPGRAEAHLWSPYKVWLADLWRCEGCEHEIVVGFGTMPISEHYKQDFAVWRGRTTVTVNDC